LGIGKLEDKHVEIDDTACNRTVSFGELNNCNNNGINESKSAVGISSGSSSNIFWTVERHPSNAGDASLAATAVISLRLVSMNGMSCGHDVKCSCGCIPVVETAQSATMDVMTFLNAAFCSPRPYSIVSLNFGDDVWSKNTNGV
jgi:hypothetical protein